MMTTEHRGRLARVSALLFAVTSLVFGAAFGDSDQQRSRELVEQGEILPLQEILDLLGRERKGRLLEVELDQESGRYIYEIELLGDAGRVWEYKIDAASGEIVGREQEN